MLHGITDGDSVPDDLSEEELDRKIAKLERQKRELEKDNQMQLKQLERSSTDLQRQAAALGLLRSMGQSFASNESMVAPTEAPVPSLRYLEMKKRKEARERKKSKQTPTSTSVSITFSTKSSSVKK
jgi:hypothetical protein